MELDEKYMYLAIEEAKKGVGFTNPNPLVGAVIVRDGRIISKGYHEKYGGLHAERNAIAAAKESLSGATIYVTLEPCGHYGKTPPCTEAIMESGITTVVVGSNDPNPLVSGKGLRQLREHGINVITGVLEEACDELNPVFLHYMRRRTPYVVMKYAMTADGKIATCTGASKWITGTVAREHVHRLRNQYMAIMVGVGTVLADDPLLNCRIEHGKDPIRIVCDTNLRTPLDSQIVQTAKKIQTILATACEDTSRIKAYENYGCEVMRLAKKDGEIDLNELMHCLYKKQIDSILLEGGATLNYSALQAGIVTKVMQFIAPKIVGGAAAKTPVGGVGLEDPNKAYQLVNPKVSMDDFDLLIEWEVEQRCSLES